MFWADLVGCGYGSLLEKLDEGHTGNSSAKGVPPEGKETAQRSSGTVLNGGPTKIKYTDIESTEHIETMGKTTRHFSQDSHTLMQQTHSWSHLTSL